MTNWFDTKRYFIYTFANPEKEVYYIITDIKET